jgi:hypothetical protein
MCPGTVDAAKMDSKPSAEQGAKVAENIRFGQAMEEGSMGGMTRPDGSELAKVAEENDISLKQRYAQGYGKGNNIGA